MNPTQTSKTPDISSASQNTENVDHTRRKIASAGLGGSAVLITLASRPVLGATCMTPSAAGSGNHSQHDLTNAGCTLKVDTDFITDAIGYNPQSHSESGASLWKSPYRPDYPFHSFFTAGEHLNYHDSSSNSYTLFEVLVGKKWRINGQSGKRETIPENWLTDWPEPISPSVSTPLAKAFVVALLNAANNYYVVLPPTGEPSVLGIEDEFARHGEYQPVVGVKAWDDIVIARYLANPGSVF